MSMQSQSFRLAGSACLIAVGVYLLGLPAVAWGESIPLHEIGDFEIHGFIRESEFTKAGDKIDYHRYTSVTLSTYRVRNGGLLDTANPAFSTSNMESLRDMAHAAGAKVNILIGRNSGDFNKIGYNWQDRLAFGVSVRDFLQANDLDGMNMDWEFPANSSEANHAAGIMNQTSAALGNRTADICLGGWGSTNNHLAPMGYTVTDRVHVMAYGGTGNGTMWQATQRVDHELASGATKDQILLGLPFFGHNGSQGIGFGTIRNWANYNPNTDVVDGYHLANNDTMRKRMRYAIDNGLAGVTIWSIGIDSFNEDHPHGELTDVVYSEVARHNQAPWRPGSGADTIGINFVGGHPTAMGQTEVAGMAPQNHWNNAAGAAGTVADLQDGRGSNSGARVTYQAGLGVGSLELQNTSGERRMMGGYLDATSSNVTTVSVSDVPYDKYYVLAYYDAANGGSPWRGQYTLTANGFQRSVTLTDKANTDFTGRMTVGGNYALFGAVSGTDTFALTSRGYGLRGPINGIQVVDVSQRISLADIVGGGNGFGTGSAQGFSAAAAVQGVTTDPNVGGSGIFPSRVSTTSNPFVDSIFSPRDDLDGYYYQPLDSAGHRYRFGLDGGSGGPTKAIFNGSAGIGNPAHADNASMAFEEIMGLGAQHGITFDLSAIRDANPDVDITAFTAIAGENRNTAGGSVAYYVFVDGEPAQWDINLTGSEQFIYLNLNDQDRFLTLAMTNSGDGSQNDLGYFANPYLLYAVAPEAPEPVPEPNTLVLLTLALAAVCQRRRRRM